MKGLDTRELVAQLRVIESVAVLSRVSSTNALGRRVVEECVANDIPLPCAFIIAREQTAGRGRGSRGWQSPAGAGIYATLLHSRPASGLAVLPLEIAVIVARFLREECELEARIKWPNDVMVDGKKIAGILIEARTRDGEAYTAIGTGINVAPVAPELASMATSISEHSLNPDLDAVTASFVRWVDAALARPRNNVIADWRSLTIHQAGDAIVFRLGSDDVRGTWEDIDEHGRARIREGKAIREVSAADVIVAG